MSVKKIHYCRMLMPVRSAPIFRIHRNTCPHSWQFQLFQCTVFSSNHFSEYTKNIILYLPVIKEHRRFSSFKFQHLKNFLNFDNNLALEFYLLSSKFHTYRAYPALGTLASYLISHRFSSFLKDIF